MNITVIGPDPRAVAGWIRRKGRSAVVAKCSKELTVVFDRDGDSQDGSGIEVAEQMSQDFGCLAMHVTVHDDAILMYQLFQSGSLADWYDSWPECLNGSRNPPAGGDAKALCDALKVPQLRERVEEILRFNKHTKKAGERPDYTYEIHRHLALAKVLNLPELAAGWGYRALAHNKPGDWPRGLEAERIIIVGDALPE